MEKNKIENYERSSIKILLKKITPILSPYKYRANDKGAINIKDKVDSDLEECKEKRQYMQIKYDVNNSTTLPRNRLDIFNTEKFIEHLSNLNSISA